MNPVDLIVNLPGEALIREGLADLQSGRRTVPAVLTDIARPRLQRAGLLPRKATTAPAELELELYRMLRQQGGDAYARYNALLRELVSFELAFDQRSRLAQVNYPVRSPEPTTALNDAASREPNG
jgi:hypothetical protein